MPAAALGRIRRRQARVAIDPVLGRIFCGDPQTAPPLVMFHYGFSADMGGGEYDRAATLGRASRRRSSLCRRRTRRFKTRSTRCKPAAWPRSPTAGATRKRRRSTSTAGANDRAARRQRASADVILFRRSRNQRRRASRSHAQRFADRRRRAARRQPAGK